MGRRVGWGVGVASWPTLWGHLTQRLAARLARRPLDGHAWHADHLRPVSGVLLILTAWQGSRLRRRTPLCSTEFVIEIYVRYRYRCRASVLPHHHHLSLFFSLSLVPSLGLSFPSCTSVSCFHLSPLPSFSLAYLLSLSSFLSLSLSAFLSFTFSL